MSDPVTISVTVSSAAIHNANMANGVIRGAGFADLVAKGSVTATAGSSGGLWAAAGSIAITTTGIAAIGGLSYLIISENNKAVNALANAEAAIEQADRLADLANKARFENKELFKQIRDIYNQYHDDWGGEWQDEEEYNDYVPTNKREEEAFNDYKAGNKTQFEYMALIDTWRGRSIEQYRLTRRPPGEVVTEEEDHPEEEQNPRLNGLDALSLFNQQTIKFNNNFNPDNNDPQASIVDNITNGLIIQTGLNTIPIAIKEFFEFATGTISPLALDLDGNGVTTINMYEGINFDHNANGFAEQTGWVSTSDGILVRDINSNGTIDSGRELFGENTLLSNGDLASGGFEALADLDSNLDGVINSNDTAFSDLKIWVDANSNGITEAGELRTGKNQLTLLKSNVVKLQLLAMAVKAA